MEPSGNGLLIPTKNHNISDISQISPGGLEITMNQSEMISSTKLADYKFYVCYLATVLLCIIAIILNYNDDEVNDKEFIFGISILSMSFLLCCILFIIEIKSGPGLLDRWWLPGMLYLIVGITIILSDPNIYNTIMDEKDSKSHLPGLSAITIILVVSHRRIKSKINFEIISGLLIIFAFLLNLAGTQSKHLTIFQFFTILIIFGFLILNIQEPKKSKVKYIEVARDSQSFISENDSKTDGIIHGDKNQAHTVIEEIVDAINSSIESLKIITDSKDAKAKEQAIISSAILRSILARLRRSTNVYYLNIENITKDLDEQDKIYFEQTFVSRRGGTVYSLPPRERTIIKLGPIFGIYGVSELEGVLSQISNEWDFNTFFINDCSGGRPLQVCGYYAIEKYGIKDILNLSENTIKKFLQELEGKYNNTNPYHNSCHAADVMCSFLYIIFNTSILEEIKTLEILAAIITSLGHDVGHPAKTNRFLIMTMDDLAIQFNDISVLEMHHASIVFKILKEHASDIIKSIDPDNWNHLRKMIIEMILATDLAKHFEIHSHFKAKYLSIGGRQNMNDPDFRLDMFKMTIKVADVGHTAKKRDLHVKWCALIVQENFDQGDAEKALGLPVSMYYERETTEIAKTQIGFIKNYVVPMYKTYNALALSQNIKEKLLVQLEENKKFWMSNHIPSRRQTSIEGQQDENLEEYERLFSSIQHGRRGSLPEKYLT